MARPNPSDHNMLRTGFKLAYARPNYMGAFLQNRAPAKAIKQWRRKFP